MAVPDSWHSHDWIKKSGQRFRDANGRQKIHCHCRKCGRDFLRDPDTDEIVAIHIGAMRYDRLDDEITNQWLYGICPGDRVGEDEAARKRIKGN
jgi:hypothetical protein